MPAIRKYDDETRRIRHNEAAIRHRKNNIDRFKDKETRRKSKISKEEYDRLVDIQPNCAICNEPFDTTHFLSKKARVIDHCHKTGKIRQLLCRGCNLALRNFNDSIEMLTQAIQYLKKHSESSDASV
jgi:carbamoylphosphate synthase small subunit